MEINVDKDVEEILFKLKKMGQAYIVGGYIRDKLLGIESKDIDIATDIDKKIILELFSEYKPIINSEKYQLISFKHKDKRYEITRLREDKGIFDGRNPKEINFIDDIKVDLKRRDFTINAFAYNGIKLIDIFLSYQDLNNRIIRVIGEPEQRLKEDRIRILRAFRFVAKCNFDLEDNLKKEIEALARDKNLFSFFSKDRLLLEFNKIIVLPYADKALELMFSLNILKHFIPIFSNLTFNKEVFKMICEKYKYMLKVYKNIDLELAYTVLFSFSGKKKLSYERSYEKDSIVYYEDFKNTFKFFTINNVKNLIYYHNIIDKKLSLIMLKRMLLDLVNNKTVCKLFNLIMILYKLDIENILKILYNIQRLYMAEEPVFLSDLDLDNVDLYNLGLNNKKFIEMKMWAFSAVLKGKIANYKYDILLYILDKYAKHKKLLYEKSSGAVVYRKYEGKYQFLIIQGINEKSFGFPKGHIEQNETEEQAAIRETKEETNIDIAINTKYKQRLKYILGENTYKEVSIFVAEAINYDILIDKKELVFAEWLDYKQAMKTLTFSSQRNILKKAMLYIYN
ncbi:NUDIX domain-containing protein [Sneathia sanguinegens]|uniref:NUDIX domain-containing protein n=1 Tax=Sneathia sanguinegens TaxID=40543 RepID=UPI0023F97AB0|nr:NUDIX domain-containing protein [Sneathia sanguinegens]